MSRDDPIYRRKIEEKKREDRECREHEDKIAIITALERNTAQREQERKERERADSLETIFANRQICIAKWLNIITAAGTIVALLGLGFLAKSIVDSEDATFKANRAWLGAVFAQINTLQSGSPLDFQVKIADTGREPALRTVWSFKVYAIAYVPQSSGLSNPGLGTNMACDGLDPAPPDSGLTVFPATNVSNWIPYATGKKEQAYVEAALNRNASLIIDGCVAYWASGPRHTTFRFLLRDAPNTVPSRWQLNGLPSGSAAD